MTEQFVNSRKTSHHRSNSRYFRPDEGCTYAESFTIDLSKVEPFVAKYPSPDDVVPVSDVAGTHLDGVFIGACTTAEEDLVMGALVLQAGLDAGLKPVTRGHRRVVPGSRPIADFLRRTGLANIYEQAGFTIGLPGCSYCVGMGADMAAPGEVWLSSQNRNFENRMGKGSFGSLASAATVAASSFDMAITSPDSLVAQIADSVWEKVKGKGSLHDSITLPEPHWVEPPGADADEGSEVDSLEDGDKSDGSENGDESSAETAALGTIKSKVYRLGDFVDTDAVSKGTAPKQNTQQARARTETVRRSDC